MRVLITNDLKSNHLDMLSKSGSDDISQFNRLLPYEEKKQQRPRKIFNHLHRNYNNHPTNSNGNTIPARHEKDFIRTRKFREGTTSKRMKITRHNIQKQRRNRSYYDEPHFLKEEVIHGYYHNDKNEVQEENGDDAEDCLEEQRQEQQNDNQQDFWTSSAAASLLHQTSWKNIWEYVPPNDDERYEGLLADIGSK